MVKIGFIDFWSYNENPTDWFEIDYYFLKAFRNYGVEYKLVDPSTEEADIVFKSVFKSNKVIKGKPIIIGYTGEPIFGIETDYSLTFEDDSQTNLYYPLWQLNYDRYLNNFKPQNFEDKDLFCSFIQRASVERRNKAYLYISCYYKPIISCGSLYSTSGYSIRDFKKHYALLQELHKRVKFNLCFENTSSSGKTSYISEKIINSYAYGTVPIYWGAENITKWFNPDSFINCNGLTDEEIVEKIREVDNNDELYKSMLYAKPFKDDINWKEYSYERLIKFLKDKNVI